MSVILLFAIVAFVTACGPPGPRALLQGRKHLEAGQTDLAVNDLRTAVSLLPTNAAAWNYLGLAYHRAGQSTNAIEAYSRAIKLDRDLLEARFNLGCVLLEENRLDAAKTELTAYTLRRGGESEGWLKLGSVHLRAREASGAEKCFREALRVEMNNVEALNGLGLAQLQRGRARDAADFFAQAVKLQPGYRPALLNLAVVSHQQLNDRAEALRRYREYLALQPRSTDWDAVNAVVRSLEQPASTAPPSRPATNGLASNSAPTVASSTNLARPLTQQVTPTKPATASKSVSNAVVTRPPPAATTASSNLVSPPPPEVVKLSPPETVINTPPMESKPAAKSNLTTRAAASNSVVSNRNDQRSFLAKLNPFRGDSKPASADPISSGVNTTTSAKMGDRREAEAALHQGQQAQRANRDAEALQFFRRATQLDPTYFEAYYLLGLTAFKMRSFPTALSAWKSALVLRPENADARYNLALTLKAANYPQDAVQELEKLLAVHPDEARAHLTLGNLYADQLRDVAKARKHYNKVLQLDPRNPQAQAIRYWLVANPG